MRELEELFAEIRKDLGAFLARRAGFVARYETTEDLLQGLYVRVLERGQALDYRGKAPLRKWLYRVARTFLADRKAWWGAIRRRGDDLVRLTSGASTGRSGAAVPPAEITGPGTDAERREAVSLALRVLGALSERDRNLVLWSCEGLSNRDLAERLDLTAPAAKRARTRALGRFRKAFTLARRC